MTRYALREWTAIALTATALVQAAVAVHLREQGEMDASDALLLFAGSIFLAWWPVPAFVRDVHEILTVKLRSTARRPAS